MKRAKFLIVVLSLLALLAPTESVAATRHKSVRNVKHSRVHHRRHAAPAVDRNAAYADVVIDAKTGQILHETDSIGTRHPASLTKMMTLYLTFRALESGQLSLNQYLRVSENASFQPPSKLGLRAGKRIRVEDAILGVVTKSANDAAVTLAESIGGSEVSFAKLMTRQAQALGMTKTRFRNPSGLPDPEQVTTARDMAIMGVALLNHFPQYYPYFRRTSFTYAGVYHHNHNRLMDRYEGMDGIKTGYIRASGFNLVASVKRGDKRVIAVVFGGRSAASRDNHMARLLDDSFGNIQTVHATQTTAIAENDAAAEAYDSEDNPYAKTSVPDVPIKSQKLARAAHTLQPPTEAVYRPSVAAPSTETVADANLSGDADTWGVQIGAYSNPENSREALANLMAEMAGIPLPSKPEPQVQKIATGGIVMYRARLMAMDRRTAQNLCAHLNEIGKSCLTVEQ